ERHERPGGRDAAGGVAVVRVSGGLEGRGRPRLTAITARPLLEVALTGAVTIPGSRYGYQVPVASAGEQPERVVGAAVLDGYLRDGVGDGEAPLGRERVQYGGVLDHGEALVVHADLGDITLPVQGR